MICKVKFCRYNTTHVTKGHKCGSCHIYGHGNYECKNYRAKNLLRFYLSDLLSEEDKCKFSGCLKCYEHKTESHSCDYCNALSHSVETCPILLDQLKIICPLCKKENLVLLSKDRIYSLEDKCKICMEENIELLLPICKHACLCCKCAKIISNNTNNQINSYILNNQNFNITYILSLLKDTPCYITIINANYTITYIKRLNNHNNIEIELFNIDDNDHSDICLNFINGYEKITTDYIINNLFINN